MKISLRNFIHGSRNDFKINETMNIKQYDIDGQNFVFNTVPAFDIEIKRVSDILYLSGNIQLDVSVICSKCLEPFCVKKTVKVDGVLSEKDSESIDNIILFENSELDLNHLLDVSLMDMDMYCSEDCRGLCPICGINLSHNECDCDKNAMNINPEFKKMRDLFL